MQLWGLHWLRLIISFWWSYVDLFFNLTLICAIDTSFYFRFTTFCVWPVWRIHIFIFSFIARKERSGSVPICLLFNSLWALLQFQRFIMLLSVHTCNCVCETKFELSTFAPKILNIQQQSLLIFKYFTRLYLYILHFSFSLDKKRNVF